MFSAGRSVDSGRAGRTGDFSLRTDEFYGGEFVEDGSFLVLNTDGLNLSPDTPEEKMDEDVKDMDIEILNEIEKESQPATSSNTQVLGEDLESSVESKTDNPNSVDNNIGVVNNSITNMSVASASSTNSDANLIESNEEVSLLMLENKKLADLLSDSNNKMKQCIATTEKLKTDHEEYKKKHEASRDMIVQLRKDNEMLKSQRILQESTTDVNETLQTENTPSDVTEQLKTVLSVNGQLNDELKLAKRANVQLKDEMEKLFTEKQEVEGRFEAMKAEISTGRQAIAKFHEHRMKNEAELMQLKSQLASASDRIQVAEARLEEKIKLTDSLKLNMEDTVSALERCNQKLNLKEKEVSLLTTKIAALNAESENLERLQVLQMQCQTYHADFEKEREERAKVAAEKDALLTQLNTVTQQLKDKSDALENLLSQNNDQNQIDQVISVRNDNSAVNSNESLPSPLTSLPSVAGQFVGFVRRELLGWEEPGAAADVSQVTSENIDSAETVVQQPSIPPCPLCRKIFPTLDKLQTHAANCGIETFGDSNDPFVFP